MPLSRATVRCVLSIAGSDSGGGAGLQADIKTFLCHRVHGTVAVTCVTAQDTVGVTAIMRVPRDLIQAQITAVLDDFAPEAAKTGFLAGVEAIEAIEAIATRLPPLVVDPVCVDKHGRQILDDGVLSRMREVLFPRAVLVTPNIAEAGVLTGRPIHTTDDMSAAARSLLSAGVAAVLVKGGRLGGGRSPDLLAQRDGSQEWLDVPRVATTAVLGAGDTLAAAIAARLAWGSELREAVHQAKAYVTACLEQSLEIGRGQGPVGHVIAGSCEHQAY
jgi:hydroxymethylpyrimidine/phosphomethylpyrimidine kinase